MDEGAIEFTRATGLRTINLLVLVRTGGIARGATGRRM
jgi:hypothetical protein